jgi:hypothetical protein
MVKTFGHLEVTLFRFNHAIDYLPYYKIYMIEYTKKDCIYDILNKINEIEVFSYDVKDKCCVNINNYFMNADILISDLVEKIGTKLIIEPISLYRVTNDLIINCQDYHEKLDLFTTYLTTEQQLEFKDKYKLEYYSSLTIILNKDYIGDHCLLIANEIIEKNNKLEKEVLEIITNKDTGMLYHTSLENRLYEDKYSIKSIYENLLSKIPTYRHLQKRDDEKSVVNEDIEIIQYFKGFNISLYNKECSLFKKVITKSRATYIHLDSGRHDLALNSVLVNKEFSLRIAGEVLLEAKDKNSDFLIVQDTKDLEIFDGMQSKIAKIVNREIKLPVITQSQFEMLLGGEKNISKLRFNTHKVKIQLLDE